MSGRSPRFPSGWWIIPGFALGVASCAGIVILIGKVFL